MNEQQMANYTLTIQADSGYESTTEGRCTAEQYGQAMAALHGTSPAQRKPLTAREIELIDGMIEVQLDHAIRCDNIANRTMAEKQKGRDMERVELLRKLKEKA